MSNRIESDLLTIEPDILTIEPRTHFTFPFPLPFHYSFIYLFILTDGQDHLRVFDAEQLFILGFGEDRRL